METSNNSKRATRQYEIWVAYKGSGIGLCFFANIGTRDDARAMAINVADALTATERFAKVSISTSIVGSGSRVFWTADEDREADAVRCGLAV